ncbi:hypothetical protein CLIB1423_01S06392 [[Candida] railenensis]|uniref:Uncharacterized protein n=1 Tax=[Candida] railenensis TaxID=45579 RepID=A0A9P0QJG4_9ASCO|nr:hypothetical protein CLIB1423_01S06392 [[Candida] railenensis]
MTKKDDSNSNRGEVDDYEIIMANIDNISKSVLSIGQHLFTKDQFDKMQAKSQDFVTKVKDQADALYRKKIDEAQSSIKSAIDDAEKTIEYGRNEVDQYFPRPYQSRDPDTLKWESKKQNKSQWFDQDEPADSLFGGPGFGPGFGHFFSRRCEQTPFGYTCRSPSRKIYRDCTDKDGLKVWDSQGQWRCLFPNAEVEPSFLRIKNEKFPDKVLTKEDFLTAVKNVSNNANSTDINSTNSVGIYNLGSKGTFFNQFSDYLDWRRSNWRESRKGHCSRSKWGSRWDDNSDGTPEKVLAGQADSATPSKLTPSSNSDYKFDSSPSVVSFSSVSSYETNINSKEVVLTETRTESYNDGTSSTKNVYKRKPIGANEWATVEEYSSGKNQEPREILSSNISNDRKGWFWN